MTGQEFRDYVVRKFLRTDKDTELYEAVTDTIADMNVRMKPEYYKEESYNADIDSLGEYKIGLPDDFGHLIGTISITDTATDQFYAPLKKISKQMYDEKYPDRNLTTAANKHTATPQDFCIYAGQIYLGPVPDVLTYRYQINYTTQNITDVTSSTDPVIFTHSLPYRTVLRNGTLFELHDGLENFEEASYYKTLYVNGVENLIDMERRNTRGTSENVVYHGI